MGQKIGLDTSVFIYLLEEDSRFLSAVRKILKPIEEGKNRGVFSCIGMIELLTGPKQKQHYDLALQYREFLSRFPNLTLCGISEDVIDRASDLRARYNLHTPDAIHLATAYAEDAIFITNDKALKRVKEVEVVMINDYSPKS